MNVLIENARNVIFDVGCVLLKWDPQRYFSLLVPEELKDRLTPETLYASEAWIQMDGGLMSEEDVARDTARRLGDEALWAKILPAVQGFPQFMEALPPAELIPQLHAQGKKVYVLSNYGLEGFARTEERFAHIFSQVDGMVISGREKMSKPDPRIYRLLLSRYQLNPAECVFIDDRAENIQGARDQGIPGILFTGMEAIL